MLEHGLPQAYGAVEDVSPDAQVTLWGPLFSLFQPHFKRAEPRTFGLLDIHRMRLTPAELFVPQVTHGRFKYLSPAVVQAGDFASQVITVDSYSGGMLSGKNNAGQRITGGDHFFTPLQR